MKLSFGKITSLPRGSLMKMLTDAYSMDPRCAPLWSAQWKEFDDFFFDRPEIAEKYGLLTLLDGEPVGFASWDPRLLPESVEVGHNCILTRFKGRGFGSAQMKEVVRRISEKHPAKIIVTTNPLLFPATKMYESAGFREIGRRDNGTFAGTLVDYEIRLEPSSSNGKKLEALEKELVDRISEILGENLVGVYLHGSLALGSFSRERSDIDYLIVVRREPPPEIKRRLMDLTLELDRSAPPKGLEMSVVLLADCQNVTHPAPFFLHYSHLHKAWYERAPEEYIAKMNGTDPDLAAYFSTVRHCGIVLCGEPVYSVFGVVPPEFILASFQNNLEEGGDPSAVLNRCRFNAYQKEGVLLSKPGGGRWALKQLPPAEHAEIRAALRQYGDEVK